MRDLSDEVLCEHWDENPLYQGIVVNDFLVPLALGVRARALPG